MLDYTILPGIPLDGFSHFCLTLLFELLAYFPCTGRFDDVISVYILHYSDWVCTAVISNDVMKDLRG